MSLSKMASTTNPSMKDDVSSQDGDTDTESICDLDDDEEKCVNIRNTVLAYVQYGISSASPDNVLEVVCTHFTPDEIAEAKDILYDLGELGDPPIRNNSKARKAAEAHTRDILDKMYKLDKKQFVFFVEAHGIARLPRFNAECLNVVAIDQRIAMLQEECTALKLEASSYRNDFLRCEHQLGLMQNVLQQHSIALRNIYVRTPNGSSGYMPHGTLPQRAPYISTLLLSNDQTPSNTGANISAVPTGTPPQQTLPQHTPPQQTTPQTTTTHIQMTSSSSPVVQRDLKSDNSQTPTTKSPGTSATSGSCPAITVPATLTSALSMTSSSKQRAATFMNQPIPNSLMSANNVSGEAPPLNNPLRFPVENRRMEHSPANGEFCMYNGAEQHSPESNDGFQKNKGDIRKQKRREEQRIKTIYGTRNAPHSRISGNQLVKPKLCDLFVSHINGDATLYDIREYISENGINVSNMRIDITSHEAADYKSFRLIGPIEDRELLLTAEFWPIDVRVKDFDKRRGQRSSKIHHPGSNRNGLRNRSGYKPQRYYENYKHYGY